jgi:hypothetical protein
MELVEGVQPSLVHLMVSWSRPLAPGANEADKSSGQARRRRSALPSLLLRRAWPSRRTCGDLERQGRAGATSAAAGVLQAQQWFGPAGPHGRNGHHRGAPSAAQRASSLDVLGRSLGSAGEEVRARRYSAGEANGLAAAPATCGRGRRPARAAALRRE